MNFTHLHLLLNHVPVIGTVGGLGLLAFGLLRRSGDVVRAALGVLLIAALSAIPTYLTGEPAEETVESLPGVTEAVIEGHEQAAGIALGGAVAMGIVAAMGLIWFGRRRPMPRWYLALALAGALLVGGLMAWTANLGGRVRHTEIRPAAGLVEGARPPASLSLCPSVVSVSADASSR